MGREYQICNRCVMDTTDPDIVFDEIGLCNHCSNTLRKLEINYGDRSKNEERLHEIIQIVKYEGLKRSYDCIIGLSGGVDSSFLAYILVKKYGIRPLAIHIDNGWNSQESVSNIQNLVNTLNIDLCTHVIDWEEFRDLQKSFLYASVVDLEMLSDHAIAVIVNKIACKEKIKYFLSGSNFQTESILPRKWFYSYKKDSKNISHIYKLFGSGRRLRTFPFLNFYDFLFFGKKYGKYLDPLSYMNYNKDDAKTILKREINWKDYGSKHHESFITKFYQTYILPKKFNIDKRKAHLSSLICANQILRENALEELTRPLFKNMNEEREAVEYFCKKMELTEEEFQSIMTTPRNEHSDFQSYIKQREKAVTLLNMLKFKK